MIFKRTLTYFFFFFLLYLESYFVSIGYSFVSLWKGLLLLLPLFFFLKKKKISNEKIVSSGFVYSMYSFFNVGLLSNFLLNLSNFIKNLTISIFYEYFNRNINYFYLLKDISFFIILSSIPFIMFDLNSYGRDFELSSFGLENASSFVGLFLNPHACSFLTSLAIIILFFRILNNESKHIHFVELIILTFGLYVLYLTYVRTGYLILLISLMFILYYSKVTKFKKNFFFFLFVLGVIYSLSSEVFVNRIFDNRFQNSGNDLNTIGSGRFLIWGTGLDIWYNELNWLYKIIGIGVEGMKEKYNIKLGQLFVSHNQFLDVLISYGLLGFAFYIIFIISLLRKVLSNKNSLLFPLNSSLVFSYVIYQFFQGGVLFIPEILISISLAKSNFK